MMPAKKTEEAALQKSLEEVPHEWGLLNKVKEALRLHQGCIVGEGLRGLSHWGVSVMPQL